jgi:3-oxoacyl-[acyl-carrier protein] reductase
MISEHRRMQFAYAEKEELVMSDQPVVIVTGGAGFIGRGLCERFAADGYAVVVADLSEERSSQVAAELSGAGASVAVGLGVDVTDETSVARMVAQVEERFGRIDVLINNAGLFGNPAWTGSLLDIDMAQFDAVMAVNVRGVVLCARAVAPLMRTAPWGRIINLSSQGAYKVAGAYSASKLAVNQITWSLAKELGDDGITVNGVAPGAIDVPTAYEAKGEEGMRETISLSIIKRLGTADDLYAAMRYFVSKEAEWCTGQTLMVNGGALVHM